ncbi:chromate transporter [Acetobacterium wieringae]|uniref:chromate transporter n=1 Tax=Acetobacterium wieringae TaxID=52694 RepID=UPI0026EB298B|nr:chromate transporter [Acetobacterium wieringae]
MIYLDLFITFFKIGLFTIGGGYAMIPLIQQEVVDHGWLTLLELTDFIAVAESTPGPFAVNIATFVGMEMGGLPGALTTTTAVVLPSFIIILLIAKAFTNFQQNKWVQGALYGMRPVVIGLIASAVLLLMSSGFIGHEAQINSVGGFFASLQYLEIIIFSICVFVYFRFKLHPIKLILISAALGMLFFGVLPMFY